MPIIKLASGENIDSITSKFLRSLHNYKKRCPRVTKIGFKVMFFNLDDWKALTPKIEEPIDDSSSESSNIKNLHCPGVERSVKITYEKRFKMNKNRTVVSEVKAIKKESFEEKVQIFEKTNVIERVLEYCDIKDLRQIDLDDPIGGEFKSIQPCNLDVDAVQAQMNNFFEEIEKTTNIITTKMNTIAHSMVSITSSICEAVKEKKIRENLISDLRKEIKDATIKTSKLEESVFVMQKNNKMLSDEYRSVTNKRLNEIKDKEDIDLNKILITKLWNQPEKVLESLTKIKLVVSIFKRERKKIPERLILELIKEVDEIGNNCRNKNIRILIGQFWQFICTMTEVCYSI